MQFGFVATASPLRPLAQNQYSREKCLKEHPRQLALGGRPLPGFLDGVFGPVQPLR